MTRVGDVWRLVVHRHVDGALNMAIDRAMQLAREEGSAPPTVRLYSWARPTVSLGRFQDAGGVDLDACLCGGVDVVRRFTGGRGVLHDDELTYSVVLSVADGVPRGVPASYRWLSSAVVDTYRRIGIDAELTTRETGEAESSSCYLQATRADLSVEGVKLSGSAQVWCGDTVLQHGSLVVARDVQREARVFRLGAGQAEHLARATRTIAQLCDVRPSFQLLEDAAVAGFQSIFGTRLVPGDLTAREAELIPDLLGETSWECVPSRSVRG